MIQLGYHFHLQVLTEALAFQPEAFELLGGGSRIPAVQSRVKEVAGDLPLRFGLDGASCVATGAAAWAAGKRFLEALEAPMEGLETWETWERGRKCLVSNAFWCFLHNSWIGFGQSLSQELQ